MRLAPRLLKSSTQRKPTSTYRRKRSANWLPMEFSAAILKSCGCVPKNIRTGSRLTAATEKQKNDFTPLSACPMQTPSHDVGRALITEELFDLTLYRFFEQRTK